MIPNLIHFINIGSRPFTFVHFLAVYSAWKVNKPKHIYFHYTEEPQGEWWDRAKVMCTLNKVERVNQIFGNPIDNPAHMADVIRLRMLDELGGIYLDLDVVCINSFAPLWQHSFVMGMEPGAGLCNAVLLSESGSTFLRRWREEYRSFDSTRWNYHSVKLPWKLARLYPEEIHVMGKYSFFYPLPHDPVHRYLWGQRPSLVTLSERLIKNSIQYGIYRLKGGDDPVKLALYSTSHALHGAEWHYRQASRAYCIHLWEGFWREPYLQSINPEYLAKGDSGFARLMRMIFSDDEIESLAP